MELPAAGLVLYRVRLFAKVRDQQGATARLMVLSCSTTPVGRMWEKSSLFLVGADKCGPSDPIRRTSTQEYALYALMCVLGAHLAYIEHLDHGRRSYRDMKNMALLGQPSCIFSSFRHLAFTVQTNMKRLT